MVKLEHPLHNKPGSLLLMNFIEYKKKSTRQGDLRQGKQSICFKCFQNGVISLEIPYEHETNLFLLFTVTHDDALHKLHIIFLSAYCPAIELGVKYRHKVKIQNNKYTCTYIYQKKRENN